MATGLAGCEKEQRTEIRMELTEGLAEFVTVARADMDNFLSELQLRLNDKVQEDRTTRRDDDDYDDDDDDDDDRLPGTDAPAARPVVGPEDGPYLFDLLDKPAFRKSWLSMFRGRRDLPPWIKRFNGDGDGVSAPSATVTVGDRRYILAWICEPHNCVFSQIRVLFSSDGRNAWGLLEDDDRTIWLNAPEPWMRKVLDRQ